MIAIRRDQTRVAAHEAAQIDAAKAAAGATVNAMVGAIRQRFITTTPGQEMIYLAKEAEARMLALDEAPDPADYPMLAAEVGITAPTLAEVGQVVLNLAVLWRGIGAGLEQVRLATHTRISAATSVEAVNAVVASLHDTLSTAI